MRVRTISRNRASRIAYRASAARSQALERLPRSITPLGDENRESRRSSARAFSFMRARTAVMIFVVDAIAWRAWGRFAQRTAPSRASTTTAERADSFGWKLDRVRVYV